MPCKTYGLPAAECKTGSKLAKIEGSICSECYAMKGRYSFPNVQASQYARLASLDNHAWVDAMVTMIGNDKYFRWHDSGDVQHTEHFDKIVEVCELTPHCKHWLPTRERKIITDYIHKFGPLPTNLIVRMSAVMFDERIKPIRGTTTTSGSHKDRPPLGHECPAPSQGNNCRDCRACWDKRYRHISYHHH